MSGAFTRTAGGVMQMMIPLSPLASMTNPSDKDVEPSAVQLVWVETADNGKTYTFRNPFPEGDAIPRFAPSLERVSGNNTVASPGKGTGLLYFTGLSRYAATGEVIQNKVYFTDVK